jgi:hypothetical protein
MPRAKHIASYPPQFTALLSQGANPNFHARLLFHEKKDAERIRSTWYGFLKALDRTRPEDAEQARAISCRMIQEEDHWVIEFRNRASDPAFAALNAIPFFDPSSTSQSTNSSPSLSIPFEDVFENMLVRNLATKQTTLTEPLTEDSTPLSPLSFDDPQS